MNNRLNHTKPWYYMTTWKNCEREKAWPLHLSVMVEVWPLFVSPSEVGMASAHVGPSKASVYIRKKRCGFGPVSHTEGGVASVYQSQSRTLLDIYKLPREYT